MYAPFARPVSRRLLTSSQQSLAVGLLSSLCSWGCGSVSEAEGLGTNSQSIVNGEVTDDYTSVVNVGGSGATCSATLIAPNLIITAMHCILAKAVSEGFQCNSDGSIVTTFPGQGDFGQLADPAKIQVRGNPENGKYTVYAHGKQFFTTNSNHACHDDLALVLLDQDVDLPLLPIRVNSTVAEGDLLTMVGYGQTENKTGTVARRVRKNVEVLAVGGSGSGAGTTTDNKITPRSAAQPNTFATGQVGCHGDSGGPAIDEETGAVIGVFSLFMNDCMAEEAVGVFTRLEPYKGLILSAFEAAGKDPWYEGAEGPGFPAPPPPAEPDAGSPEDEEGLVGEDNAPRRRLTSGCSVYSEDTVPARSSGTGLLLVAGLLSAVARRRATR